MGIKDDVWRIEPHVCRACFGRILSRAEGDARLYRCADCGTEKTGHASSVLCSCGIRLNARTAGVRCEPNVQQSPEFPFEICAVQK